MNKLIHKKELAGPKRHKQGLFYVKESELFRSKKLLKNCMLFGLMKKCERRSLTDPEDYLPLSMNSTCERSCCGAVEFLQDEQQLKNWFCSEELQYSSPDSNC